MNKKIATDQEKSQALVIAQNILKTRGNTMTHNQLKAVQNFIGKLNNSQTRNKVTAHECQKIVNTANTFR